MNPYIAEHGPGPIQKSIEAKLQAAFVLKHLDVQNESHMHSVPPGSESHFRVEIVSDDFEGKMLVHRHRAVNKVLQSEFAAGLHALTIHAFTPAQWQERGGTTQASPECLGGSKAD